MSLTVTQIERECGMQASFKHLEPREYGLKRPVSRVRSLGNDCAFAQLA